MLVDQLNKETTSSMNEQGELFWPELLAAMLVTTLSLLVCIYLCWRSWLSYQSSKLALLTESEQARLAYTHPQQSQPVYASHSARPSGRFSGASRHSRGRLLESSADCDDSISSGGASTAGDAVSPASLSVLPPLQSSSANSAEQRGRRSTGPSASCVRWVQDAANDVRESSPHGGISGADARRHTCAATLHGERRSLATALDRPESGASGGSRRLSDASLAASVAPKLERARRQSMAMYREGVDGGQVRTTVAEVQAEEARVTQRDLQAREAAASMQL